MKITAVLLATIVVASSMIALPKSKALKSYSYFCVSHAMPEAASKKFLEMNSWPGNKAAKFELPPPARIQQEGGNREVVFLTKLRDTLIAESDFDKLTEGWTNWVNEKCVNQFGCTSDLLYYDDHDRAVEELNKTFKSYADNPKYELRMSDY